MPAEQKEEARAAVAEALATRPWASATVSVRVNGTSTPWFEDDVRAVAGAGERLDSVIVPKAESPGDLERAEALLSRPRRPRAADRAPGADRVGPRAARRQRDRRGLAAPRGADPRPGRHERLARLRLARRRDRAGTSSAAPCSSPPARPACRRSTARSCRSPTPTACAPPPAGRASSASTASGRFIPPRSSP